MDGAIPDKSRYYTQIRITILSSMALSKTEKLEPFLHHFRPLIANRKIIASGIIFTHMIVSPFYTFQLVYIHSRQQLLRATGYFAESSFTTCSNSFKSTEYYYSTTELTQKLWIADHLLSNICLSHPFDH